MSLNSNDLPAGGGGNIEPLDVGTYPTRTVAIVDLGMQAQPAFQGKEKPPVNMIAFTYEFVDEFLQDEDGNDIEDKPRWLTEMMPFYQLTAEKAKSTARYKALDPTNKYAGDFEQLTDIPCNVSIVHNPKKGEGGGVWENIGGVTAMREKDVKKCPALVNDVVVFNLDVPTIEGWNALPSFVQDKIKGGLEYEGSTLYDLLKEQEAPFEPVNKEAGGDDESPY